MSKGKLWKTFRKNGELLLKIIYIVWVIGSKIQRNEWCSTPPFDSLHKCDVTKNEPITTKSACSHLFLKYSTLNTDLQKQLVCSWIMELTCKCLNSTFFEGNFTLKNKFKKINEYASKIKKFLWCWMKLSGENIWIFWQWLTSNFLKVTSCESYLTLNTPNLEQIPPCSELSSCSTNMFYEIHSHDLHLWTQQVLSTK